MHKLGSYYILRSADGLESKAVPISESSIPREVIQPLPRRLSPMWTGGELPTESDYINQERRYTYRGTRIVHVFEEEIYPTKLRGERNE